MFYNHVNPTLLHIGPFEIRYYGVIFVLGFVIAYFLIYHLAKERKLKLTKDDVADFLFYIIIGVVVGSRLAIVLFADPKYYFSNPFEIIAIWHGGLSFHGGLIGAVIAGLIFTKKKKINFYDLADITVIPLAIGLFFGRIGNFLNSELVGRVTNLSWGVNFNNEVVNGKPIFRHPSQLYESFKNLVIFFVLWFLKNKKLPKGFLFWLFIAMYGLLRTLIEFFRYSPSAIGPINPGQIWSFPMFIIGVIMLIKLKRKKLINK